MSAARRAAVRVERMRRARDRRRSRRILERLALELADFDADGFVDAWGRAGDTCGRRA